MSATYRQASVVEGGETRRAGDAGENDASDVSPSPRPPLSESSYSRFPRRRLTGEALRDAILFTSCRLNPKAGGPSVNLPLPAEVSSNLLKKQAAVTPDVTEHDRRSIYTFARRNLRYPLFDLFDRPDALMTCSHRNESTTAPQALLLFNSEFSQGMARSFAQRVLSKSDTSPEALVTEAMRLALSRPPSAEEFKLGTEFLRRQTALAPTLHDALADYCLALINSNAFVWVD